MASPRPALAACGYRVPVEQREGRPYNGHEPYYVALTTRAPVGVLLEPRYVEYSRTMMGRGLLLGRASWPGVGEVVLSSTHLESFIGKEAATQVRAPRPPPPPFGGVSLLWRTPSTWGGIRHCAAAGA